MRTVLSKAGEQLFKAVHLKIFFSGNERSLKRVVRAPKGKGINANGIEEVLMSTARWIETKWPNEEYSLVALGPCAFNFVWRNARTQT